MIKAKEFIDAGLAQGLDFYTGVPCSFLTPLINGVISDKRTTYVAAASEGEAVAIASGAWLAGKKTLVMFQNSGFGNAINPLTSLNFPFRIPTYVVCTWRAGPGLKDEPQHELMGEITPGLFELIRIPHAAFPTASGDIAPALTRADTAMEETGIPYGFIMQKGDVADEDLDGVENPVAKGGGKLERDLEGGTPPTRYVTMERMLSVVPDNAAIIATTGKCGRELFTIADRPQHLYQVGSMGCAVAMGLGTALCVKNPVVVVDGDGALLMHYGTLATVGAYAPKNLVHLVLDNGTYDSTGGQPTVSGGVDFAQAAIACGYKHAVSCDGLKGFEKALKAALKTDGPTLIHMKIAPGSLEKLGRPTITPPEVARRMRAFLAA